MTVRENEIEFGPLAARAVLGDPHATSDLLARLRPLMVRYCRARLGPHNGCYGSADDVAQEVCLAVLTALPHYRDQGKPFVAFAYRIAANKVADAHRSSARTPVEPVDQLPDRPDWAMGPEQHAVQSESSARLAALLARLPETHREVLVLRVAVGLSAEEVGDALAMSPGSVRVTQHRALTRLRKLVTLTPELVS